VARILIIEDDDRLREMLSRILQHEGYDVADAPDGKAGMRLHHEKQSDLVVTDIFMPEKDGLEVIRELRRDFPDVKIIAMSGGSPIVSMSYLPTAKMFGAHHILSKPFKLKKFVESVNNLIGQNKNL